MNQIPLIDAAIERRHRLSANWLIYHQVDNRTEVTNLMTKLTQSVTLSNTDRVFLSTMAL